MDIKSKQTREKSKKLKNKKIEKPNKKDHGKL